MAYHKCDNCGKYTRLKVIRVTIERWFGFYKVRRRYDPEGKEGMFVCNECEKRMKRLHETKDISMNDILNDLPF